MLTTPPGPDVAPCHNRQVAVMPKHSWSDWLGHRVPAAELLAPGAAGSLKVEKVG